MRRQGHRIGMIAVLVLLFTLLAVPVEAHAADATGVAPSGPVSTSPDNPDSCVAPDPWANGDQQAAPDQSDSADQQPDSDAPDDPVPPSSIEGSVCVTSDGGSEAVPLATTSTGTQLLSQANPDTKLAVEAAMKASKRQFDPTAATLQRSIDQLAGIIRRLDAAGVNVSGARARLSEARVALNRAKTAQRVALAKYRAVIGAEDEAAAFAQARAAARSSNALLERARIKVLTATRTLRAIVKNVTVQNAGASTDST